MRISLASLSLLVACVLLSAPNSLNAQQGKAEVPQLAPQEPVKPKEPLFKKHFPNPTGRNGMEEYLAAADRVRASDAMNVYRWESIKYSMEKGGELDEEDRTALAKMPFGDPLKVSVLEARRIAVRDLVDVRELVRKGNLKPVEPLHGDWNSATNFPELAEFKNLTKFFVLEAYVAFADGRTASGTDTLLVALNMGNRLPQDSCIARLVTVAINAIVLAEFERHLDRLSTKDIGQVRTCLMEMKAWESGLLSALQGEARGMESTLKQIRENPKDGDLTSYFASGSEELFKAMKPADWIVFADSVRESASSRFEAAQELLKLPEQRWFAELKAQGWKESEEEPSSPKTISEAGEQFGIMAMDMMPGILGAEAKYRTQLRLLRLHMRILDHKWRTGRLPERLELAAPPEELQDSFGGGEFQFLPDKYGHYQLYSKGFRNMGRIDLRYRRDLNAPKQGDDGELPPPMRTAL